MYVRNACSLPFTGGPTLTILILHPVEMPLLHAISPQYLAFQVYFVFFFFSLIRRSFSANFSQQVVRYNIFLLVN